MATTTRVVPLATYPSGSRSFGPFPTPNGLKGFSVNIGRCTSLDNTIWQNVSTVVNLYLQFSYDNGVSWTNEINDQGRPVNGIDKTNGGIETSRSGSVEVPEERYTVAFNSVMPEYINGPTNVKGRVEVINGPIKTYVDVTIP